jgi:protocatechuate 4,5-dioxygenase beta chain
MARIVGAINTSHVPAIGKAMARRLQQDPEWKPFFDGFVPVHEWLDRIQPDVAVVIYNDHGLGLFLDKMPTFAVAAAAEYRNEDEGWGLPVAPPFPGDPRFSWHLIESLVADEFDVTSCQELLVDHAFAIPMNLMWPNKTPKPVRSIPVLVNAIQHPLPSPSRCFKFGRALGRAIESYPEDLKVLVVGTGGMSHQLDGTRAGFINKEFDRMCLEKLVDDPKALTHYSIREIAELAGAQGVEIIMWLIARATLMGNVSKVHSQYRVPVSNTATGLLVLENAASAA